MAKAKATAEPAVEETTIPIEPAAAAPQPVIVAAYLVRVTLRGDEGTKPPTNKDIERAIEDAIEALAPESISVRASSERVDQ
jgi:hypothetical protein